MKIFFGEKLVRQNEYLANNKNLVYHGKKLLVLSNTDLSNTDYTDYTDYTEISLANQDRLVLWGKIYAVQSNGIYLPIDISEGGDCTIKNIFDESESDFDDIIGKIEGDFVGCLIKKDEDVVIFSDNFNRKDVFYSLTKNGLSASTDLASVIPEGKKSYDQAALANFLSIFAVYAPKKHTIYKDVRRLGVGERLIVSNDKIRIDKLPFSPLKVSEYGTRELETRELEDYANILEDAVRIRGSNNDNNDNWVYLSSGWDSTALLALLVKIYGSSRVKAVIGKMEYASRSGNINKFEIERAKKVAEYYSIDLEIVPWDYTTKKSIKDLEKIKNYLKDNHIYHLSAYNFYLLSDYISKNGKKGSVFSGEISDGAHNLGFSQFTTILEHPVLEFREYSDKMASYLFGPTFFKSILNGTYSEDAVYKLLRSRLAGHVFEDSDHLNEYERKAKFISSFFIRSRRIPFYSLNNLQSLTDEGAKMYDSEMFNTYLKESADNIKPETVYSWILYLYNSFHWQGSTIKSINETARYNNLNIRMPFWDIRLQQFLSKMPENWGRGLELRPTKYPLKWMLEHKIDYPIHLQVGPHSYLYDINPNFAPIAEILYGSAFVPYLQNAIKDYPFENILDSQYFNIDYYRKLTDDYIAGVEVSGQCLSDLYGLIWLCWIGWY